MWARLAHAAVRELEGSQFEAVPRQQAQAVLQSRKLGVAKLRLLPKRTGKGRAVGSSPRRWCAYVPLKPCIRTDRLLCWQ